MSLKRCREIGGSRFSFRVVFGSFGADQREAHGALNLVLVFSFLGRFCFLLRQRTGLIADQREAHMASDYAEFLWTF